jgi:ubiquinone/menaquinone biosynthesis C-methylase UbiE
VDHTELTKQEFARQADRFATASAVTDTDLTQRIVDALGAEGTGTVLDVACGPGIVSAALARRARAVVALDITPAMLAKAEARCAAAGFGNVTFREGSATALPFADGAFDAVVTRLSLHHFREPARALAEMARVLRPGGACVVADIASSEDPEESALHNALEVLRDPSHVRMLSPSELRALIAGAGFAIEAEATWEQPRAFEEWAAIVDDPARTVPLRPIVRALAATGQHAGFGLALRDGAVVFVHRWLLISARKPSNHVARSESQQRQ